MLLNATSRDDFACCRAIWRCWPKADFPRLRSESVVGCEADIRGDRTVYFCVIVGTMLLELRWEQRRHPARLLTTNPQVILRVLH